MLYVSVICTKAGDAFPFMVDVVGSLVVENNHGIFAPDVCRGLPGFETDEDYLAFSTVKNITNNGQEIVVTTMNSTWIFEQYVN